MSGAIGTAGGRGKASHSARPAYRRTDPKRAARPGNAAARAKRPSALRELGGLILKIALIAGIAMAVGTFVFGVHYNADPSMSPAIKDGDLILFYRFDKAFRAGDLTLVAFRGDAQVRRVVATAGDTVDISAEGLMINGALQAEPEIYQRTERYAEGVEFPITLAEDEIFVLADAREGATDSRIYGAVNVRDTQGNVIAVMRRRSL